MSVPIRILSRSFRLILAQPFQTIRVIFPGLATGAAALAIGAISFGVLTSAEDRNFWSVGMPVLLMLGAAILLIRAAILFAVMWHRHALLLHDERKQIMRPIPGTMNRYLLDLLGITLLAFAVMLPIGIVVGFTFGAAGTVLPADGWLSTSLDATLNIIASWIVLRVSLVLPATSIGRRIGIKKSWAATRPVSWDVFWTAVLLGILNALGMAFAANVAMTMPGFGIAISGGMMLLQSLLYVSVLSTLYGYLIEGRSLT